MITQAEVMQVLSYNSITGIFTWLVRKSSRAGPGDRAGNRMPKGYRAIQIDGVQYYEHRLAWLYMHGVWPDKEIDHKDGITDNNIFDNLKQATRLQQVQNFHEENNKNKLGFMGVYKNGSGFATAINVVGKRVRLGTHESAELAHLIYMEAKRKYHEGWHLYGR